MKSQIIFLAVIIAACHAKSFGKTETETENSLEQLLDLDNFDPIELMKGLKEALKEECRNVTGSDEAYNSIESKPDELLSCLVENIDVESIMFEVERSISTDSYDVLFTKVCHSTRQALPCVETFSKSMEICMDEEEKQLSELSIVILNAAMNFICSKDISELDAIFNAPKDVCITSKMDAVEACANSTIIKYFDDDDIDVTIKNVHKLLTTEEGCNEIQEMETCALAELNQCDNKKAIEVAADIFKSVIGQTPCKDVTKNVVSLVGNNL